MEKGFIQGQSIITNRSSRNRNIENPTKSNGGNMKSDQLIKIGKAHPYILLRHKDGQFIGVNTKIVNLARRRFPLTTDTIWVSYIPCSFDEYLTHKTPLI